MFLLGFAKSELDNIDDDQLAALKKIAAAVLGNDDEAIATAVNGGTLWEIDYDDEA